MTSPAQRVGVAEIAELYDRKIVLQKWWQDRLAPVLGAMRVAMRLPYLKVPAKALHSSLTSRAQPLQLGRV
jgi:hypothetical protein